MLVIYMFFYLYLRHYFTLNKYKRDVLITNTLIVTENIIAHHAQQQWDLYLLKKYFVFTQSVTIIWLWIQNLNPQII